MISQLKFYFILITTLPVYMQQIFDETYSTCSFVNDKDGEDIAVINQVWEIWGVKKHASTVVKFSLCELKNSINDCDNKAAVCSVNKLKRDYNINNAGTHFIYTKDERGRNIFKSVDGHPCDETDNFTAIIELAAYPDISTKPKFNFISDCEIRLEMMDPTYIPKCTLNHGGSFIDMRGLKNLSSLIVEEPDSKKKFSLNICKHSDRCDEHASACEIFESNSVTISDIDTQRVVYEGGVVSIRGRSGDSKRSRRNFNLDLNCNWKAGLISNLKYVTPKQQGKNFIFSAESSLACIKFPVNCLVRENYRTPYFLYDLRSLFQSSGGWLVKNVTDGKIRINMCGPLENLESECLDQHSQVCKTNVENIHLNLGSIQKDLHVTTDDQVITTFADGSVCLENKTKVYSTEILFICKAVEEGPVLNTIDGCVHKIKWYTPAACPKNQPLGEEECRISDLSGIVNLKVMHQADRTHILTPNSFLRYNLCGALNKPCNNNTNTGVCQIENGKERILGIVNKTLVMNNEIISTSMTGDKCNGQKSEIKINFYCTHGVPPEGQVEIKIVRDHCDYEFNIYTPSACPPSTYFNCKFYSGNMLYDLSSLSRNDGNYEIKDGEMIYSLNFCRSVIKTNNARCSAYTSICMKNLTEPHVRYRYISLGNVNTDLHALVEGSDLIINYTPGSVCNEDPNIFDRSSSIRLKCSTVDEGPKLLKKSPCYHEFIWSTPKACGTEVTYQKARSTSPCVYEHPVTKKIIDFKPIDANISFHIHNGTSNFSLNPCTGNYTYCNETNNCNTNTGRLELKTDLDTPYLMYHLFDTCDINTPDTVYIRLICEPTVDMKLEGGDVSECVIHFFLKTRHVCSEEELEKGIQNLLRTSETHVEDIHKKLDQVPQFTEKTSATHLKEKHRIKFEENSNYPHLPNKKSVCIIHELNDLNLERLKNVKVSSLVGTNHTYTFNFEDEPSCDGLICKNSASFFPKIDNCPLVSTNFTFSMIQLLFKTKISCLNGYLESEVNLRCKTGVEAPILIQDTNCKLVIQYPIEEVCNLFQRQLKPVSADSTGLVVGSSVGLIALLLAVTGGFFVFKKQNLCRRQWYTTINGDKENTFIYARDTSL